MSFSLSAQTYKTVSGTIKDASGQGVIGAGILVKGTTNGTTTNSDGTFSLTNIAEGTILEISCIGYKTQEVTASPVMNIVLEEGNEALDEVIFVAYGTTKKSSFTGSASVVKADQIEKISGSGFAETLQGMSAGVQVVNNEGTPGADSRIQIRGISSMSGKTTPLYIVDGMPYDGTLTSINPSDIESMTVLKDAAASSLYGSRAAMALS
jgi:TonB-dependent SusC/RagA subfamily outer membrane receptor